MRARITAVMLALAVAGAVLGVGSPALAAERRTAAYYQGDQVVQIVRNLGNGAAVGMLTCGLDSLIKKVKGVKNRGGLPAIAALSAEIAGKEANVKGMCKFAHQLLKAAVYTAALGLLDRPVWVEEIEVTEVKFVKKTVTTTYLIGLSNTNTQKFSGSVTMGRWM